MKDYSKIVENKFGTKHYFNESDQHHRLTCPAIEWPNGCKSYYINDIFYMHFYKIHNKLYIHLYILELNLECEVYIKQNIKDLIEEFNPKIILCNFDKDKISKLPVYIKNIIVI